MRQLKKLLSEWLTLMKEAHANAKRDLAEIKRRMKVLDEISRRN